MVISLQNGLRWFLSPAIYAPSTMNSTVLFDQKNIVEISVCDFWHLVINDIMAFALLPWITVSGRSQVPCHKDTRAALGNILVVNSWGLSLVAGTNSLITRGSQFGSGPLAPVKPSDNCSLGWWLDFNLMRDPKLEPAS